MYMTMISGIAEVNIRKLEKKKRERKKRNKTQIKDSQEKKARTDWNNIYTPEMREKINRLLFKHAVRGSGYMKLKEDLEENDIPVPEYADRVKEYQITSKLYGKPWREYKAYILDIVNDVRGIMPTRHGYIYKGQIYKDSWNARRAKLEAEYGNFNYTDWKEFTNTRREIANRNKLWRN